MTLSTSEYETKQFFRNFQKISFELLLHNSTKLNVGKVKLFHFYVSLSLQNAIILVKFV